MSDLQGALQDVGYQPTTTQRQVRRRNIEYFDFPEAKPAIKATPITRPRRVVISKAGGFIKARYAGRKAFVFGLDERHAVSRLKTWDGLR